MRTTPYRLAYLGTPLVLAFLVGCSSAGGNGTGPGVTSAARSSPTATAAATPSPTPTPPPVKKTAAPTPVTTVNRADPGPFAGEWKGNGSQLDVSGDESANASYMIGVLCSSATPTPSPCDDDSGSPTIPGGQLKLHITEVDTTGNTAVAIAEVKDSSDPKYPEGSTMKFTLKNGVITSPIGKLTKV